MLFLGCLLFLVLQGASDARVGARVRVMARVRHGVTSLSFTGASCDELNKDFILTADVVDKLYELTNCNLLFVFC
jgi:hypothetical protein